MEAPRGKTPCKHVSVLPACRQLDNIKSNQVKFIWSTRYNEQCAIFSDDAWGCAAIGCRSAAALWCFAWV